MAKKEDTSLVYIGLFASSLVLTILHGIAYVVFVMCLLFYPMKTGFDEFGEKIDERFQISSLIRLTVTLNIVPIVSYIASAFRKIPEFLLAGVKGLLLVSIVVNLLFVIYYGISVAQANGENQAFNIANSRLYECAAKTVLDGNDDPELVPLDNRLPLPKIKIDVQEDNNDIRILTGCDLENSYKHSHTSYDAISGNSGHYEAGSDYTIPQHELRVNSWFWLEFIMVIFMTLFTVGGLLVALFHAGSRSEDNFVSKGVNLFTEFN
jgi:hypothetical protein